MQNWGRGRGAPTDSRDQPPSEREGSEVVACSWGVGRESGCLIGPALEDFGLAAPAAAAAATPDRFRSLESREGKPGAPADLQSEKVRTSQNWWLIISSIPSLPSASEIVL